MLKKKKRDSKEFNREEKLNLQLSRNVRRNKEGEKRLKKKQGKNGKTKSGLDRKPLGESNKSLKRSK